MKYKKLNDSWDAEPNAPQPSVKLINTDLLLTFKLNYLTNNNIPAGHTGMLTFKDCLMYRLGAPNVDGFARKQFRFSPKDIPWGGFYELFESGWEQNFPADKVTISGKISDNLMMKHYLFFFKDETFECIAAGWSYGVSE